MFSGEEMDNSDNYIIGYTYVRLKRAETISIPVASIEAFLLSPFIVCIFMHCIDVYVHIDISDMQRLPKQFLPLNRLKM